MGQIKYYHIVVSAFIAMILLASCSSTRNLPEGDALYIGARVKADGPSFTRRKRVELGEHLADITRPRPNKKFLGMRFKLWAYNFAGKPKKRNSPAGWLKFTVGEPPVLLSEVKLEYNEKVLRNTLENRGYFHAQVTGDTVVRRKKARATYAIQTGEQYLINEVIFDKDSSSQLQQKINETASETFLKKDEPFDLDVIKGERARIDNYLKEHGFYYFSPDFLIIQTDSTIGNNKVNLYVKVKPNTPEKSKEIFTINDVYIMPNYRLNGTDADTSKQDAVQYKGYYVVDKRKIYNPRLFEQSMQFYPGDIYNRTDHNLTINRLITLGVFKFVKNRFAEVPSVDTPKLNVFYYLTPLPKKSLRAEINANTKSNNLTGSAITIGWRNRNTLKGGELFTVDATVGSEVQFSSAFQGYNTFRAGIEAGLDFPRFLVPFFNVNAPGGFVPKTKLLVGYDIVTKQKLYTMNSFRASMGYYWKESLKKEHQFNPISITYVQPLSISALYDSVMKTDPTLEKAVEKQFILGSNYSYTYNGLTQTFKRGFYFNGVIDVSGNVAGLLSGANAKQNDPKFIFNAQFAQYLKLESDLRYYAPISEGAVLANRIIVGVGLPYGNSLELPFIKQFFVGGNNSIRAFRSRSVGPGTYLPLQNNTFLPDQSGDIKLEMNTELRMRLAGIVHGAVFVDAGNIWLFNETPEKPGAKFNSSFLSELAVGAGVGLRFDISFLVLRFDVAFPLRKPYLTPGNRWVINQLDLLSPGWRKNNLVYNLGIGYPF
ncbi:MAG: BamA/TamA family outer membrane protein [Chitinophagaceae bacterium]